MKKITLCPAQDIPFDRLELSQANVRRVKAGCSIEQLADDIARRGLVQSLNVRPILDADGIATGRYEVPAGGRRFRALEMLVRRKRLAKTAPVPCIVRAANGATSATEDSLAENVQREALHPLDQFRAFKSLRDEGQSEEDIAARFFVTPAVVRQRLKLVTVSPKLLDLYAEDGITLEQLMAFSVNPDPARQEAVWAAIGAGWSKEPWQIRRLLTEGTVRAGDRRARFVGIEGYEAAGGVVLRDLFDADHDGWLQDAGLLEQLMLEKLRCEAEAIVAEGWKWVDAAPEFPYGHHYGMRLIASQPATLGEANQLAHAVSLDMVEAGWRATVESYFDKVTKPRILEAVREARGEVAAGRIAGLRKPDMAAEAERLVADSGWLPMVLRGRGYRVVADETVVEPPQQELLAAE